jgi:hypothetical protein
MMKKREERRVWGGEKGKEKDRDSGHVEREGKKKKKMERKR